MDIMLDLETLSIGDNPVIIQLSAIAFCMKTGETLGEFNEFINIKSCIEKGFKIDESTMEWWFKQKPDVLINALKSTNNIEDVLVRFSKFLKDFEKPLNIWGNGSIADNKWTIQAFNKCSIEVPWKYYENRDVRTLVDLGKRCKNFNIKEVKFEGEKHNALDDCKHQIEYTSKIFNLISTIENLHINK